jgi:hypothetical protein
VKPTRAALLLILALLALTLVVAACGGEGTTLTQAVTTASQASTSTTATSSSTASSPNTWTKLNPAGTLPSARSWSSMAYDPGTSRVIMFGGGTVGGPTLFNDTWAYDPAANTWTELDPQGTLPAGRSSHQMVYAAGGGRLIMFGGRDLAGSSLNDTWAYDPAANTWTELDPQGTLPARRTLYQMVYDPSSGLIILFGGRSGGGVFLNDTWAYDPAANNWTELKPSGTLPPPRALCGMAYDPAAHRLIMFAGATFTRDDDWHWFDDTWAYDPAANTWTDLSPEGESPSERDGPSMVYDPSSGLIILFGGMHNDTWAYDATANAWTDLSPAGTVPSVRDYQSMVYAPPTGRAIMFGGLSDTEGDLGDTWAYRP